MTCGINLGFLPIFFVLLFTCSWATYQGARSWKQNQNLPVASWRERYRGSTPQDGFRHVYMAKQSSTNHRTQQHSSQSRHDPSVRLPSRSALKPRWTKVSSSNAAPKPLPESVSGRSEPLNGFSMTLPGRTGSYAPSKTQLVGSQQHSAQAPHLGASGTNQRPGSVSNAQSTDSNGQKEFKRPKEHMRSTSGLSWGRKVDPKSDSKQRLSSNPLSPFSSSFSEVFERLPSQQLSFVQEGSRQRLEPGQRFAPTNILHIPSSYGGVSIRRLADEDEEKTEQADVKERSKRPMKVLPLPKTDSSRNGPTQAQEQKPMAQKSRWMMVRSRQLNNFLGLPVEAM